MQVKNTVIYHKRHNRSSWKKIPYQIQILKRGFIPQHMHFNINIGVLGFILTDGGIFHIETSAKTNPHSIFWPTESFNFLIALLSSMNAVLRPSHVSFKLSIIQLLNLNLNAS